MTTATFECERCGACCRAINCKYLVFGATCSIYKTRPKICRVDEMVDICGLDREIENAVTKTICQQLRERY